MYRCINLDWLEIFCIENPEFPLDPEKFRREGWEVEQRAYGTRQYEQMFTLCRGTTGLYEIRRKPLSKKSQGGILNDYACHIRLCNRQCYVNNPVVELSKFLQFNHIHFKNISRYDIAMDFQTFDFEPKEPQNFIQLYMEGKIAKIHQSRLAVYGLEKNSDKPTPTWDVGAHGEDTWKSRTWNSLKWGSPTSEISTKMYNKKMELARVGHDKPYIRECWNQCGFNPDIDTWRIEFSIHSGKRHMVEKSSGQFYEVTLEQLASRELIAYQYDIYFAEYFHFKHKEMTRNGTPKRKDLCSDVVLFVQHHKPVFTPITITSKKDAYRTDIMLVNRLKQIITESRDDEVAVKYASALIIQYINYYKRNVGFSEVDFDEFDNYIKLLEQRKPLRLTYDHNPLAILERATYLYNKSRQGV